MGEVLRLRKENVDWLSVEDEVIVLDATAAEYLSANRTGALLWKALTEGTTRELLVDRLIDTFGIDKKTAQADVETFIEQLSNQGLLET